MGAVVTAARYLERAAAASRDGAAGGAGAGQGGEPLEPLSAVDWVPVREGAVGGDGTTDGPGGDGSTDAGEPEEGSLSVVAIVGVVVGAVGATVLLIVGAWLVLFRAR